MLVKKTEVDVHTGPSESVGGAKVEPEQRPVLTTDTIVPQSHNGQQLQTGQVVEGERPGMASVGLESKHVLIQSAAEAAEYLSAGQCGQCRHFCREKGQAWLEKARHGDGAERQLFTKIRNELSAIAALEIMGGSIYMDSRDEAHLKDLVSSELGEIGLCEAHSKINGDEILVMPEGTCLDGGYPNVFEAISADVEKQLEKTRDLVLTTAAQSEK